MKTSAPFDWKIAELHQLAANPSDVLSAGAWCEAVNDALAVVDGLADRLRSLEEETKLMRAERDAYIARADGIEEQLEAADRVLAVADQLAEWCRVATSVDGVFSNNLGAQAQGQGMANLVVRYVATRESYPASIHALTTDDSQNEPPDLETDDDFAI